MLGLWKNVGLTKKKKVLFSELFGLITCRRVPFSQGPEDTFHGSAQGKSPCQVDVNEGLVECRTGLHVESEVVLKCERNNNEGACDMLW